MNHDQRDVVLGVAADVTRRIRADEVLPESEQRYRTVADFTYDWELWIDPEDQFVYCSPSCERITGHGPAAFQADPGLLRRVIHPEDLARFDEHVRVCEKHLKAGEGEWRVIRPDGTCRWVAHACQPVFDHHGQYLGVRSSTRDITERKRAEDDLKALTETLEQRVAERTKDLQMLHDVASIANRAQNAEQAMQSCLQRVAMYHNWCFGHALVPAADNGDELTPATFYYGEDPQRFCRFREVTLGTRFCRGKCLPGRVLASGKPEWTMDLRRDLTERRAVVAEELGIGTAVAFPVLVGETVVAVLELFSDRVMPPNERMTDAMVGVGMQLGRVIERADLVEHLLTIAEEIQRGIAQDLHDDVGQELTGLGLKAETLAEMRSLRGTPAGGLADDIALAVERTRGKVRGFSRGMLPLELEEGLLAGALGQLASATTAGSRIACRFDCSHPDQAFDGRIAMHLYRIAQEAVSNAVRHSGAKNIRITLDVNNGETGLRIEDDGTGLSSETARAGGMGLQIMGHRAGLIGARLSVGPGPGGGTQVACRLGARGS